LHEQGKKWAGIDAIEGKVGDMWNKNVIEPANIIIQAIKSAVEAAIMILKIDDIMLQWENQWKVDHLVNQEKREKLKNSFLKIYKYQNFLFFYAIIRV